MEEQKIGTLTIKVGKFVKAQLRSQNSRRECLFRTSVTATLEMAVIAYCRLLYTAGFCHASFSALPQGAAYRHHTYTPRRRILYQA